MVRVCPKPRCARRRSGCICPNSWTLFLSRESALRRRQGRPRAAFKTLRDDYRKAKRDGAFAGHNPPCYTDVDKLCRWSYQKDLGWPLVGTSARRVYEMRRGEAGRRIIRQQVGQGFTVSTGRTLRSDEVSKYTVGMRLPPNFRLHRFLGEGIAGRVMSVVETVDGREKWYAVKCQKIENEEDDDAFTTEVYWQQRFHAKHCSVNVRAAWTAPWSDLTLGVVVMDPIDGTLDGLLRKLPADARDRKLLLNHIARQVKLLYEQLRRHNLVHGDMHFENMAVRYGKGPISGGHRFAARFPSITFIDMGRSFHLDRDVQFVADGNWTPDLKRRIIDDADRYWVWRAASEFEDWRCLAEPLKQVGFPASFIMEQTGRGGRPTSGSDTRSQYAYESMLMTMQTALHNNVDDPPPVPERR